MAGPSDRLSKHFTLAELTRTSSGLPNEPASSQVIESLRTICTHILEPVRAHFDRPVMIHSGYRSLAVNTAVGGSPSSDHLLGEAVDFHVSGFTVYEAAIWISENLDYHQVILENFVPGIKTSGWVHCAYRRVNKDQRLTKFKGSKKYYAGIILKPE